MFCYLKILLLLAIPLCSREIRVSHTILKQESYYQKNTTICERFIDFLNLKMYKIDSERVYRVNNKTKDYNFNLIWVNNNNKDEISIECKDNIQSGMKCINIDLMDHYFMTFDFDKLIFDYGGIFSYLLILYGLFSLRTGYVYFNLTALFYCSFAYILFVREIFDFLELNKNFDKNYEKSQLTINIVFYFSLFTCILYGVVCHISKYLKYITFGFIDGLFFAKIIYYVFIRILTLDIIETRIITYLITEIITCLLMMVLFVIAQNKNDIINIINIVLISSYGIIFGINILFGGLPFIPYYILGDQDAINTLQKGDSIIIYSGIFIVLFIYGFYKNHINFKIAIHGKKI